MKRGMEPLVVRAARPEDAAAIAAIWNQGIALRVATFETEPRTEAGIRAWLAARTARHPAVVAERGGTVVAWAAASEYSPRDCYARVAEFSIYAEAAVRGTGAARAALQGLIDACEQAGITKLIGKVFTVNGPSRGLCRKLGFREVGIHQRHARLDGEWRDVVVVERLLGEAQHERPSPDS